MKFEPIQLSPFFHFNFEATGVILPAMTIARDSFAMYYDKNGMAKAAPANVPRIEFDPKNLSNQGLLMEPARANLFKYSNGLTDGYWSKTRSLISAATDATCPIGSSVFKLVGQVAEVNPKLDTLFNPAANQMYVFSGYVKAAGVNLVNITFAQFVNQVYPQNIRIDLSNGKVYGVSTAQNLWGYAGGAIPVGNGWYRFWIATQSNATPSGIYPTVQLINNPDLSVNNYVGDGTNGVLLAGLQLEAGRGVTSYISTGSSTATRAGDNTQRFSVPKTSEYTLGIRIRGGREEAHYLSMDLGDTAVCGIVGNTGGGGNGSYLNYYNPYFLNVGAAAPVILGEDSVTVFSVNQSRVICGNHMGDANFREIASERPNDFIDKITIGAIGPNPQKFAGVLKELVYFDRSLTMGQCQALAKHMRGKGAAA